MTHRQVVAELLFTVLVASNADAVCVDWSSGTAFTELISATAVIFEGTVRRIDEDKSTDCAPDRVVFAVHRVWKGPDQTEQVLLQTTLRIHRVILDGREAIGGCPTWVEQDSFDIGQRYIVLAGGTPGHLESMGCGLSSPPTAKTRERLDKWLKKHGRKGRTAAQQ